MIYDVDAKAILFFAVRSTIPVYMMVDEGKKDSRVLEKIHGSRKTL